MKQETVGTVTHNGVTYEVDWRYHEENGEITAAENSAWIFLDDRQLADFVNPDPTKDGWQSIDELMADARRYITSGALHARIAL